MLYIPNVPRLRVRPDVFAKMVKILMLSKLVNNTFLY